MTIILLRLYLDPSTLTAYHRTLCGCAWADGICLRCAARWAWEHRN